MYDFYLGSAEAIANDESRYLIAVKRMMPRWINSLPDSEFLALAAVLDAQGQAARDAGRPFVAVETGAGASSLAMAFYAMKYEGTAWSWDMNSAKGSAIRQVAVETMGDHFGRHVNEHWRLVAYNSLSPYLGLPILPELAGHVDVTFHDSEHTWDVLGAELEAVMPLLAPGAVIALDDANMAWEHTNLAYVNTFRRKLGLGDVPPIDGNEGEPFHARAARLLEERFTSVEHLADVYKERYRDDPYLAYYNAELDINAALGSYHRDGLEHRFESWRVEGYRDPAR
jgi:hypothetical protein